MGIDLLPVLLMVVFIIGIKPVAGKGKINENYLSVDTGNSLRGLFAIVVVFHHIAHRTADGLLIRVFSYTGYLAVAIFFFLSGYGLQKSYIASENYKKHFLRRRLSKVLIPYAVVTALFWMMYALEGNVYSLTEIIALILSGSPLVSFSWYMLSICYFYIAYWFLMRICKRNYNLMMVCACIWYGIYIVVCRRLGYGDWWYNAAHLLIIGMFWATYEDEIIKRIKAWYPAFAFIAASGFFLICYLKLRLDDGAVSSVLTFLVTTLFTFFVISVTAKMKIGNPVTRFLGRISMEIYLVQGLFIHALRSDILYIENDFLWAMMVSLGSIGLATILHQTFAVLKNAGVPGVKQNR